MEYPDCKRSIRRCLGTMHSLLATTNGLGCAAIAQKMVRICCHKTWAERRTWGYRARHPIARPEEVAEAQPYCPLTVHDLRESERPDRNSKTIQTTAGCRQTPRQHW